LKGNNVNFSEALEKIKLGKAVAREGWNGKGMWIAHSPGCSKLPAENFWSVAGKEYAENCGGFVTVLPALIMRNAKGQIVMGWLASQEDMLACDWEVVEPK
jgi:hypothetical protein